MIYVYDAEGSPVGFRYRNSTYYSGIFDNYIYGKNVQGDIIYIFTRSGDKVAEFSYDAWGNLVEEQSDSINNPGIEFSPFRYRGYWYDKETGLYYLNSRYYNPKWGRFLNADIYLNANGDIIGFNMFAYCGNEPIMSYDPKGEWTVSFGVNFSAFLIGGVSFSACISLDSSGGIAFQTTKANIFENTGGVVIGAGSVGLSSTTTITNCDSVDELEGIFTNIGGSVNVYGPLTVGAEANLSSDWDLVGGTVSVGVGAGVDAHVSGTKTKSKKKGYVKDFVSSVAKTISGVFSK